MNKYFLLIAFFVGSSVANFAQQTRILFLGNSYTSVNNLPGTLSQLALSLGDSIYYESNTPGGYMLIQHTTDATSLQKINTPGWDYVVLQAQSQEPSLDSSAFYYQTYPYARKLDSLIHLANPCAITLFYMTWGRKYGDSYWCPVNPPSCTFLGMNGALRERYLEMAQDNFSRVAPAGVAWKNSWSADSSINLWSADNSHPSMAGTYLTANVFYASIFKQSTASASYTGGLSAPDANFLKNVASNTVLDSLDTWMLNQDPIHASFSYNAVGNDFQFFSNSYNASSYNWNFGDGNNATGLNPIHTYLSNGTYQVQLVSSNACYSDTSTLSITAPTFSSVENQLQATFTVFPNPTISGINLLGENMSNKPFILVDIGGKTVKSGIIDANYIDLSNLPRGIYFLQIDRQSKKITIQ